MTHKRYNKDKTEQNEGGVSLQMTWTPCDTRGQHATGAPRQL